MRDDSFFRWIALAIVVVTFTISKVYRKRADLEGGRVTWADEDPMRPALTAGWFALMAGLVAYLVHPPLMSWSMVPLPTWVRWAGVALGGLTALGALWVFRSLGRNVTPTVVTRPEATLVTHGPYRFIRHPLYVNGALAFVAVSLMSRSWWFAALMVPTLALLSRRTRTEEANLAARFGRAWDEYAARTGRFVPRLRRS